tara:strand:- start:69 stop:410 length:342 start_codon:yes stop_codon:yes gene_type:complete
MNIKILSLSKNEDFKNLLGGKKISGKYITIFFKKLKKKHNKKLSISFVTKRKLGNAVIRNKIKRRLKNIMSHALKKININLEYSYLFLAKKNVFDHKYNLIKENIFKDLKKIK